MVKERFSNESVSSLLVALCCVWCTHMNMWLYGFPKAPSVVANFFQPPCTLTLVCRVSCQVFERILYIWAIRHPASGYVQGINDLVTPFFVVFLSEYLPKGRSVDLSLLCQLPLASRLRR